MKKWFLSAARTYPRNSSVLVLECCLHLEKEERNIPFLLVGEQKGLNNPFEFPLKDKFLFICCPSKLSACSHSLNTKSQRRFINMATDHKQK